ncbi:MAG: LamG domain-containing protein [Polyangiales bacterium]
MLAPHEEHAPGVAVVQGALAGGAVRSIDGSYGTCVGAGKTGASWSVSLGGALTFGPLSVVVNDAACRLSLTRFHTATTTYTATPPIALSLTVAGTPTLFTSASGNLLATAKVDTLSYAGGSVGVTLYVGDARFVGASQASRYTYDAEVVRDAPLSYWRLGESVSTLGQDPLNDTNMVSLQDHAGAGVSWALHASASSVGAAAVFDQNHVRAQGSGKVAVYSASTAPLSGDYDVSATVRVAPLADGSSTGIVDQAGVLGRLSTNAFTAYFAGYLTTASCVPVFGCSTARGWILRKYVNGAPVDLGAKVELVAAARSNVVTLRMRGTSLEVLVDGASVITATDASITSAGKPGLLVGGGSAAVTFNSGTLIDSVDVKTYIAYDAVGANHGAYSFNVQSTVAGALSGPVSSSHGAFRLTGANHLSIPRDTRIGSGDFSIEFWFKYAGNSPSLATSWYYGMGMVDALAAVIGADGFGVSMRSDGKVMAGAACGALCLEATILTPAAYGDGQWHHLVFTRKNADGMLTLYVDGVSTSVAGPANRSLNALATLNVGRLQIQLLGLPLTTLFFTGAIDELAVYDKVLSSARVEAHHQARGY